MSVTHLHPSPLHEQWRSIPGYEDLYEVSTLGHDRSLPRRAFGARGNRVPARVLRISLTRKGYPKVDLYRDGVRRTVEVHRLVLLAFVGPCPEGMEGCHNNGVSTDVGLANLRWDTRVENSLDTVRHGHNWLAARTHCKRGHEFTPENTRLDRGRWRRCRKCQADMVRDHRAQKASRSIGMAA